jgi:general secretion pathway protein K
MTKNFQQQGVAIIMVLLIVAIATSLAAYIAMQQNLWQRQVESQFDRAQARQLGLAGINWARAVLAEDKRTNSVDHKKEIWSLQLPAIPVESGEVEGWIEDMQGKYNLNNVVYSANDLKVFEDLLLSLGLSSNLAPVLADWIENNNTQPRPGGAKDGYYLALPQPYRAANLPLVELGELVKVRGFDSRIIDSLRPYVTVLPAKTKTPINVNFASAEVLAAAIPNFSVSDARLLEQQRPFMKLADFNNFLQQKGIQPVNSSDFSVESTYFWVHGTARIGNAQVETEALLERTSQWPTVVWQSVQ